MIKSNPRTRTQTENFSNCTSKFATEKFDDKIFIADGQIAIVDYVMKFHFVNNDIYQSTNCRMEMAIAKCTNTTIIIKFLTKGTLLIVSQFLDCVRFKKKIQILKF